MGQHHVHRSGCSWCRSTGLKDNYLIHFSRTFLVSTRTYYFRRVRLSWKLRTYTTIKRILYVQLGTYTCSTSLKVIYTFSIPVVLTGCALLLNVRRFDERTLHCTYIIRATWNIYVFHQFKCNLYVLYTSCADWDDLRPSHQMTLEHNF